MARSKLPAATRFYDAGCRFRRLKGERGMRFSISVHMPADDEHDDYWWSKPRRVELSTPNDKVELLSLADQYREELLHPETTNASEQPETMGDYVEHWRRRRAGLVRSGDLSQETVEREETELRHIERYLGDARIVDLDASAIENAYASMSSAGVSKYTRARTHAKLKSLLNQAIREGIIRKNPCENVASDAVPKMPDADKVTQLERRVTIEEADQLMYQIRHEQPDGLRAAVWLAYMLGLRRGEALGLRWCDIDTDAMVVHVHEQQARKGRKRTKTEGSVRDLPLAPPVWAYLEEWRNVQQQHYRDGLVVRDGRGRIEMEEDEDGERVPKTESAKWTDKVNVCTNADHSGPWNVTNFNRSARVFFEEHGLGEFRDRSTFKAQRIVYREDEETGERKPEKVTYECSRKCDYHGASLHSLRHTYATSLVDAGVNVKVAQKLMGHSNIKTTLQIYADETERSTRAAAEIHAQHVVTPEDELAPEPGLLEWMQENM